MELPLPKLHALALPFPAHGHINPLLNLCQQLAASGSTITFVNTPFTHSSMPSVPPEAPQLDPALDIRFVTIPNGLPTHFTGNHSCLDCLDIILDGMEKQKDVLEALIKRSHSSPNPISCIISDHLFPWTQDLANELGIARAMFWTSSAAIFFLGSLIANGKFKLEDMVQSHSAIFSGLPISNDVISSLLKRAHDLQLRHNGMIPSLLQCNGFGTRDTACVLLNSFSELEGSLTAVVPMSIPIRFVGPLLPYGFPRDGSLESDSIVGVGCADCLSWLDGRATSSVLYISFGSIASLSLTQLNELAFGIEASQHPFLWVALPGTQMPEGFIDRTKDRGLVISWAPQLQVLKHPAISAFLTHCGWNSVMESMYMGVPMLCLPICNDGPLIEVLIVRQWKAGLGFQKDEQGLVERGELTRVLSSLMLGSSEEAMEVRKRAAELGEAARQAVGEAGSSRKDLNGFFSDVIEWRKHPSS